MKHIHSRTGAKFWPALSVVSLLAIAPMQAMAQNKGTKTLDAIVVTATKTNDFGLKSGIPIEQVPQSVQVIDHQAIVAGGARSIDDALRAVPSATVAASRIGTSSFNVLKIRGFQAYEMRNGIRQRYFADVDSSALSNIERIEVLKGPSGVLYGQSGVGGIVSIITRQPTDHFAGSVSLTGGSFDQKSTTLDLGGPLTDTFGVRLTGEVERSGTFVDYMDLDRENVALTLAWKPSDAVSAHFVSEFAHRKTLSNPGLPVVGTVIGNGVSRVPRSTFLGEPGYSLQENRAPLIQSWVDLKLNDSWTLTPRFQYSEFNNTALATNLLAPVAGQPTLIQRQGRNAGEDDLFRIFQLDLAGQATVFGVEHSLLFGLESSADRVNFRVKDHVPCGVGPIDALNPVYGCGAPTGNFGFLSQNYLDGVAAYAQDQIALTTAWNVVAGVRRSESRNNNYFNGAPSAATLKNTSWQLGSTYALADGLSLFGGYNTGYDLEWVTGARKADGTPFQPETSDQAEAGLRLTRDTVSVSVSAFRIRRNNVAVPDPAHVGFQLQEGQFRVNGAELEGEWSPLPGWWLQGGYAYLDGVVSRTTTPGLRGARLAETPEQSATVSTRYTLGKIELRAAANYVGARKMINGGAVTLPGYVSVNLGAGTQFGRLRIDANLSNVFNKVYYYSDNASVFSLGTENRVLPGEPRTLSVRLTYAFGSEP